MLTHVTHMWIITDAFWQPFDVRRRGTTVNNSSIDGQRPIKYSKIFLETAFVNGMQDYRKLSMFAFLALNPPPE